jgi:hypothetical protein
MRFSVIPLHSFVDLITNSSSELFVCATDKTVKAVKDILYTLCPGSQHGGVFGDIEVSKITSQKCPELEEYQRFHDWNSRNALRDEAEKLIDNWKKDPANHQYPKSIDNTTKKQEPAYDKAFRAEQKASEIFYAPYNEKAMEVHDAAVRAILRQSDLDENLFGKPSCSGRWSDVTYTVKQGSAKWKLLQFIELVLSWGMTINKGDVIIHSASDNSVPYEAWDSINSLLNGKNYHLG